MVSYEFENGLLTIKVNGRVDSQNANETEKEIFNIVETNETENVILDIDGLEYVSSAGLRVILRLKKTKPQLKIINACNEVYDVFEITGFSEMIEVTRAYRKLSVDNCEVIGTGSNGKVYRIDPDTIIKVYFDKNALPDIQKERELARKAFILGIPTAIPYDVVKVGDTYGSVFELLNANSFSKLIKNEPQNIDKYIDLYVDLMKKIHSTHVLTDEMPHMKDTVVDWVKFLKDYLPADKYEKLLKLVEEVPDQDTMMHGDYHVKNLMMQNGEVLLIDMDTLCKGHPIFELASVYNAYIGFYAGQQLKDDEETFISITYGQGKKIWHDSLRKYLNTTDEDRAIEIENKAALIGFVRVLRRTIKRKDSIPNHEELIEIYKNKVLGLIDKVDTLLF